jgi:hypothetical protein
MSLQEQSGGYQLLEIIPDASPKRKFIATAIQSPRFIVKRILFARDRLKETIEEVQYLQRIAESGCRTNLLCYTEYFYQADPTRPDYYYLNLVTEEFKNSMTMSQFISQGLNESVKHSAPDLLRIMYQLTEADTSTLHNVKQSLRIAITILNAKPGS